MPFGVINAVASFCRLVRIVLRSLRNVGNFVDDNYVDFFQTWEDHKTSLCDVLDRLRSAKLIARLSKCITGYCSIKCLDHNIVVQTIRPKEDKIQANRDAVRHTTKTGQIVHKVGWILSS